MSTSGPSIEGHVNQTVAQSAQSASERSEGNEAVIKIGDNGITSLPTEEERQPQDVSASSSTRRMPLQHPHPTPASAPTQSVAYQNPPSTPPPNNAQSSSLPLPDQAGPGPSTITNGDHTRAQTQTQTDTQPELEPNSELVVSSNSTPSPSAYDREMKGKKRSWAVMGYGEDEQRLLVESSTNLHLSLLLDQTATLYPPPPTAFTSFEDIVDRLLPYHVWQIHDEELEVHEKGKDGDIREANDLVGCIQNIQERFTKARRREDEHTSLPSLISQLNQSTTKLREELSSVQSTLRSTRMEYNALHAEAKKVEDEKRRAEMKVQLEEEEREREKQRVVKAASDAVAAKLQQQQQQQIRSAVSTFTPTHTAASPSPSAPLSRGLSPLPPVSASTPPRPVFATSATNTASSTATPSAPLHPAQTPSRPSQAVSTLTPERGRPRGRPRGRGRGGLREAVVTHTLAANGTPSTPSKSAAGASSPSTTPSTSALPGAVASGSVQISSSAPAVSGPSAAGGTPAQGPVAITVNLSLVPQLVALGLLVVPPNPAGPKTPATVLRTSEDKKGVVLSINLSMCSKNQLLGLAKVLNVSAKPGTIPVQSGPSAGTGPAADGNMSTQSSEATSGVASAAPHSGT